MCSKVRHSLILSVLDVTDTEEEIWDRKINKTISSFKEAGIIKSSCLPGWTKECLK